LKTDRSLVLEIVTRYRESLAWARRSEGLSCVHWLARAEAYNEVYTELKGLGYAAK